MLRSLAPRWCFGFDDMAARAQMNIVKQILAGRWDTRGDAGFLEQTKHLFRTVLTGPSRKVLIELLMMLPALASAGEARVSGPRRLADDIGHAAPFIVARASDDNPVVLAATWITAVWRIRLPENFIITHGVPLVAVDRVVENRRSHHRALRFEHAGFDELPFAGARLVFQRGEHPERHGYRSHAIGPGDLAARLHRRVRITPQAHDSRVCEQLPTPRDPRLERSGETPARHDYLHDARI